MEMLNLIMSMDFMEEVIFPFLIVICVSLFMYFLGWLLSRWSFLN